MYPRGQKLLGGQSTYFFRNPAGWEPTLALITGFGAEQERDCPASKFSFVMCINIADVLEMFYIQTGSGSDIVCATTAGLTFFFLLAGVYAFGLFTVDIFVNAGQVVTGNLAPYFLTVCKPNYTALGCQQALRYISHQEACTGNQDDILRARKSFPSKEAALSIYAALYVAVSSSENAFPP